MVGEDGLTTGTATNMTITNIILLKSLTQPLQFSHNHHTQCDDDDDDDDLPLHFTPFGPPPRESEYEDGKPVRMGRNWLPFWGLGFSKSVPEIKVDVHVLDLPPPPRIPVTTRIVDFFRLGDSNRNLHLPWASWVGGRSKSSVAYPTNPDGAAYWINAKII